MSRILTITKLEPTVFFQRDPRGELEQQAVLTIENSSESPLTEPVTLIISGTRVHDPANFQTHDISNPLLSARQVATIEKIPSGHSQFKVYLHDLREPHELSLELHLGAELADQCVVSWQPQKHWNVYLVHGSHHDLGYTDIPSNVLEEHDRHLDRVIEYCEQTHDWQEEVQFRYVIEQAWSILHYVDNRPPDAVARLAELIRQGRIEVTAFLDNLTSELCGHEEQIRSVYPAFHLAQRFHFPIKSAEHNDIPGISWGLASVLSGSGVRYFAPAVQDYFAWGFKVHPNWDEETVLKRDMPGAFWWEGPSGQRVLCWFSGNAIENTWLWTFEDSECEIPLFLEKLSSGGYTPELVRAKVLGGRRDNAPPDKRISEVARQWNERWAFPRLRVSTNAGFFERFEREYGHTLRSLRGDLPNTDYPIGAISHAKEVAINRQTHDLLPVAEKFAAIAALFSEFEYPEKALNEAFDCSLFHDGHCGGMAHPIGPAQAAAWSQKNEFAYRANALAQDVLVKSINRIADQIRLEQDGYHITVFNPLPHSRTDIVRMMVRPPDPCGMPMYWHESLEEGKPSELVPSTVIGRKSIHLPTDLLDKPLQLVDTETGTQIPVQVVRLEDPLAARPLAAHRWALGQVEANNPETIIGAGGHQLELVFIAKDVPALGYKTFQVSSTDRDGRASYYGGELHAGDDWIENQYYRIVLDRKTGAITSLYDKQANREWVDSESRFGFNQLLVRSPQTGSIHTPELIEILPGEKGPLCASLIVKSRAPGCPQLTQEITLYEGTRKVDIANRVLKDATPLLDVYFAFPFNVEKPRFRFEASNSVIEPICDQLPGTSTDAYTVQHWVSLSDEQSSVTWSSLDAPVVVLGKLWPGYVSQAHHGITPPGYGHEFLKDPNQFENGHIYSYVMNNNFRTNFDPVQVADVLFRYSMTGQDGDWRGVNAAEFGWGAANPLQTVCIKGPQEGSLKEVTSFCSIDQKNGQILALKQAEDGDGLIIRLAELYGLECRLRVSFPLIDLIQVLRCDLVERNLEPIPHDRHFVDLEIRPYQIITIRCQYEKNRNSKRKRGAAGQ